MLFDESQLSYYKIDIQAQAGLIKSRTYEMTSAATLMFLKVYRRALRSHACKVSSPDPACKTQLACKPQLARVWSRSQPTHPRKRTLCCSWWFLQRSTAALVNSCGETAPQLITVLRDLKGIYTRL
jgi:hypothetical protein